MRPGMTGRYGRRFRDTSSTQLERTGGRVNGPRLVIRRRCGGILAYAHRYDPRLRRRGQNPEVGRAGVKDGEPVIGDGAQKLCLFVRDRLHRGEELDVNRTDRRNDGGVRTKSTT